jgi:hypothetical protein
VRVDEQRLRGIRVGVELLERDPEVHAERDQALLRTVVEISLEPPPLVD